MLRVLAALLLTSLTAGAQFVVPEGREFHNGATLPLESDGEARSLLQRLGQAVSASDADEAAHLVRALRARDVADLVAFGPRTHVPALEKAVRLAVRQGSPELVGALEADASVAVDRARRFRDLPALLDLSVRGRSLQASRRAAWHAARLLFEQGRWWEASSLARRARGVPGAEALAAAAEERLAAPEPPVAIGPMTPHIVLTRGLDFEPSTGLPLVTDGRPREVLVLDALALQGLDLASDAAELVRTFEDFEWGAQVLSAERFHVTVPAPREHVMARVADRCVFPFNVSVERGWRSPRARRDARLLAIDLDPEPRVAWIGRPSVPDDFDPRTASSAFGPPTISGDRLFVQLFRTGPDTEVSLVAFDLESGERLFETPLVTGPVVRRFSSRQAELDLDDLDKRAREGAVAVRDGSVYACTGFGVVAAVDGVTGAVQHTFRYDRLFALDKFVYDPAFLFDTGGWNHEPVRLFGDRVVVAPSDSRFLYMLALEPGAEGQLILDDPIERLDRVDLVTLLPDPLGRDSPAVLVTQRRDNVSSLALLGPDGHVLARSEPLGPDEGQVGRPLAIGPVVALPTELGVRLYDARDLARPPVLMTLPPGLPPARAVHVVRDGLVVLCPDDDEGVLSLLFYKRQG